MRRLIWVLALLFAGITPLRAAPKADPLNWLGGPIAPQFFAYDLDDRGWRRFPFDMQNDMKNGAGHRWDTRVARQFTEGSRQATHVSSNLRLDGRLGAAMDYTQTDAQAFKAQRRSDLVSLYSTADLSRTDGLTLEYGFGMTVLWSDKTYPGPSFLFIAEKEFSHPFSLYGRYAVSILGKTSPLHDLTGGVGVNWKRIGVEAGYRALINGLRNVYGPEVALRLWL